VPAITFEVQVMRDMHYKHITHIHTHTQKQTHTHVHETHFSIGALSELHTHTHTYTHTHTIHTQTQFAPTSAYTCILHTRYLLLRKACCQGMQTQTCTSAPLRAFLRLNAQNSSSHDNLCTADARNIMQMLKTCKCFCPCNSVPPTHTSSFSGSRTAVHTNPP